MLVDHEAAAIPLSLPLLFREQNCITIPLADTSLETELSNSIKIYRDKKVVEQITYLVNKLSSMEKSLDFVQVPPKLWMRIYWKSW